MIIESDDIIVLQVRGQILLIEINYGVSIIIQLPLSTERDFHVIEQVFMFFSIGNCKNLTR